jgi:hypothetical protein
MSNSYSPLTGDRNTHTHTPPGRRCRQSFRFALSLYFTNRGDDDNEDGGGGGDGNDVNDDGDGAMTKTKTARATARWTAMDAWMIGEWTLVTTANLPPRVGKRNDGCDETKAEEEETVADSVVIHTTIKQITGRRGGRWRRPTKTKAAATITTTTTDNDDNNWQWWQLMADDCR